MRRLYPTFAIGAVMLTLGITACGTNSIAGSPVAAPNPVANAPVSSSSATNAPSSTTGHRINLNITISDPDMGDQVVAQTLIRDIPMPPGTLNMADTSTMELAFLQITATAGAKYQTVFIPTDSVYLMSSDGFELGSLNTDDKAAAAMTAAGCPPFPKDGVLDPGETGTGWISFQIRKDEPFPATLRLMRTAAKVVDTGQTIPDKNFDVPLPSQ